MTERPITRVLFLCTGNSARSILAEVLLNRIGEGRFRAFSAGSRPRGEVHPLTLETLRRHGERTAGLRSKSWNEFAEPGDRPMNLVVTVCGSAAGETCPIWPGTPVRAHWDIEDPAAVAGSEDERRAAFDRAYREIERRVHALVERREKPPAQ